MKKWMIATLFALLTMLLCTAYAEDGHNWKYESINDTYHVRYCDGCGTHSGRYIDQSSIKHTYRCEWPESMPEENSASIVIKCTVCDWSSNGVVAGGNRVSNPTCTTPGKNTFKYSGPYDVPEKDRTKTYTLPTLSHRYDQYTRNHDATCTTNETETAKCYYSLNGETDCTAEDTREIPNSALGHQTKTYPAKAATCTEDGWEAYEACTREGCDYTTRVDIPAPGHDLVHHDAKAPTCTDIGWDAYDTCFRCDYNTRVLKPAKGHDLVHHDAKAPTCTQGGWDAYDTCKNCSYTTHQAKAALGHDLVHHDAKAPTCTDIGWDAYDTCSRCDYTTYQAKAALGHDLVHHEAKDATCTDIGWDAYDACSRCDYTTYAERAALGHDYQARTIAPTCTEQGRTVHTCSRCADRYSDAWVNALGHWFGDWAPAENETHTAACLREGCGTVATVECFRFTFTLPVEGEEVPLEITLCPVCGGLNEELALTRIETATAEAVTGSLPMGDLCLRIGALDNGEMLMTVCFEYDGAPVLPTGQVKITLPAELIEGSTLVLLCADGTLTELAPEIDGENASFTLDFTGAESPVCALRLAG